MGGLGRKARRFILLAGLLVGALLVVVIWISQAQRHQPVGTSTWKTYENSALGFSIRYPNGYDLEDHSVADQETGPIILLKPMNVGQEREIVNLHTRSRYIVVSRYTDVNDPQIFGGTTWLGQRRYTNLADLLNDRNPSAPVYLISKTQLGGLPAFELAIAGYDETYAIMAHREQAIYSIEFPVKLTTNSIERQIISTFRFTK